MIVIKSQNLDLGSLLLITPFGGIIGSLQESHVCVPDQGIEPRHCKVYYNKNERSYCLIDLSKNGFTSLSHYSGLSFQDTAKATKQFVLNHASVLRLGEGTELLVHIHPGRDVTCNECEPGIVQQRLRTEKSKSDFTKEESTVYRKSKEKDRRSMLKALKRKYGINEGTKSDDEVTREVASETRDSQGSSSIVRPHLSNEDQLRPVIPKKKIYRDRAAERRATRIGSQNPYEKTDLTVGEKPIGPQNKGYKLLTKMGWSEGQRLGTDSSNQYNLLEPLIVTGHVGTTGLGSTTSAVNSTLNYKTAKRKPSSHLDDDCLDT